MNVTYAIAGRLSLRPPQRNSLKILDRQEIAPPPLLVDQNVCPRTPAGRVQTFFFSVINFLT
jgi:hypothetical protein